MRKIKEILRLHYQAGLSRRGVAAALKISYGSAGVRRTTRVTGGSGKYSPASQGQPAAAKPTSAVYWRRKPVVRACRCVTCARHAYWKCLALRMVMVALRS
jgi:hypothetical protein